MAEQLQVEIISATQSLVGFDALIRLNGYCKNTKWTKPHKQIVDKENSYTIMSNSHS